MKSLSQFSNDLRKLPLKVAQQVATSAAPAITKLAERSFAASEDPYHNRWKLSVKGQAVTLDKTGALKRQIRYVAIGTKLRVKLGVAYAKYQIGKRPVYPQQAVGLPDDYVETLKRIAVRVVRDGVKW